VPSSSLAAALTLILAGELNAALLAGLPRLTTGGTLGGGFTLTVIAPEVVTAPALSVALAVNE
jgi:hypothetical protein